MHRQLRKQKIKKEMSSTEQAAEQLEHFKQEQNVRIKKKFVYWSDSIILLYLTFLQLRLIFRLSQKPLIKNALSKCQGTT